MALLERMAVYALCLIPTMALEASRSAPTAGFFLDEATSSSTQDSISAAVRNGQRRASISDIEAVHSVAKASRDEDAAREFRLLKLDALKLDGLKASKVMSLVAEGARAAAESVAQLGEARAGLQRATPKHEAKKPQRSPSALGILGQMRQAPISALQRTDTSSGEHITATREAAERPQQPQRLPSKSVAYDEASAEEASRQLHEEEAREDAKVEDLMDEIRNRRPHRALRVDH